MPDGPAEPTLERDAGDPDSIRLVGLDGERRLSSSLNSSSGRMPSGRNAGSSMVTARSSSSRVALQRSQVSPCRLTSRCQTIGNAVGSGSVFSVVCIIIGEIVRPTTVDDEGRMSRSAMRLDATADRTPARDQWG